MNHLLYRYRNVLFFTYLGFSVFFLLKLDSVFNGGFYYSVRLLWLPLAIVIFGYTWLNRTFLYSVNANKIITWVLAVMLYALSLLMTWPYVMAVNALTSNGDEIVYQGPIEKKWISKGKQWSYHLVIRDQQSMKKITVNCSKKRYYSLSEGDVIVERFYIGGLDFPFRWK